MHSVYYHYMQTNEAPNLFQLIGTWLVDHGIAILLILGIAWLLLYFGSKVIKRIIRQVIRNSHFYVISAEDARKTPRHADQSVPRDLESPRRRHHVLPAIHRDLP